MNIFDFYNKKSLRGFTLIEVMVAVSIFTLVVTSGIVALLTINNSYRKSQTDRQSIDSLTFVLETMSRRIRTAQTWDMGLSSAIPTTSFSFIDQEGDTIVYNYDQVNEKITLEENGSGQVYDITPSNVKISKLIFTPFVDTGKQSYVQINIQGNVTYGKQVSDFSFQTGVSKRTGN